MNIKFISYFSYKILSVIFLGNGYIEGTELDGFLREFISSVNAADVGPEVSFSTKRITIIIIF